MKSPINPTGIAMRNISHVVYHIKDDSTRWYKVNWIIVSTSHAICKTRGVRGHMRRQKIRCKLWNRAQRKHPVLKRYAIPHEITGDCRCKIKWYYRILDIFSLIIRP